MAQRPCAEPECDELVRGQPGARCQDHERPTQWSDHSREAHRWVYASPRWRAARRAVLHDDPWCANPDCGSLASHVDHVVPLRTVLARGGDPFDRANLQGLCQMHHTQKTSMEVHGRKA